MPFFASLEISTDRIHFNSELSFVRVTVCPNVGLSVTLANVLIGPQPSQLSFVRVTVCPTAVGLSVTLTNVLIGPQPSQGACQSNRNAFFLVWKYLRTEFTKFLIFPFFYSRFDSLFVCCLSNCWSSAQPRSLSVKP